MGSVLAVCRVHQLLPDTELVGVTAIDKRPVEGPVKVNTLGVYGDVQADRKYHGGTDKAVYAYAQESAEQWARRLGIDVTPGLFGENLRTADVRVDEAVIGERWRVGDTVLLEVTCPRTPCRTFGNFLRQQSWPRRFADEGLPGAYLRVVRRGHVAAGDPVDVVHRPDHGVSVSRWFTERSVADARALDEAEHVGSLRLAVATRTVVDAVLARA